MDHTKKHYPYYEFPSQFFDLIFQSTIESNSLDVEVRLRNAGDVKQRFYRSKRQVQKEWPRIQVDSRFGYDVDFTVVPRERSLVSNKEHQLPEITILNCCWADIDVGGDKPFATRKAARKRINLSNARPSTVLPCIFF